MKAEYGFNAFALKFVPTKAASSIYCEMCGDFGEFPSDFTSDGLLKAGPQAPEIVRQSEIVTDRVNVDIIRDRFREICPSKPKNDVARLCSQTSREVCCR